MWLFSFFLIPILFSFDFFQPEKENKKSYLRYFIGLLLAIGYSILIMLIYSPREYTPANFWYLSYRNLLLFVLPLVIVFILYFLVSVKSFFEKLQSAADFAGFYTIFIPFYVLSYFATQTFSLFVFPILFTTSLFLLSYSLSTFIELINTRGSLLSFIFTAFFILIALVLPSFLLALWTLGISTILLSIFVLLYLASAGVLIFLYKKIW